MYFCKYDYIKIDFDEPIDIYATLKLHHNKATVNGSTVTLQNTIMTYYFYDSDNKLLLSKKSSTDSIETIVDLEDVSSVRIVPQSSMSLIKEFEFFSKADPIICVYSANYKNISLDWNEVTQASAYEVYNNNVLVDTVTDTNYELEGLIPGIAYNIKIKSICESYASSVWQESIETKNFFVNVTDEEYTSATIKVDEFEGAISYEYQLDDNSPITSNTSIHKFEDLTPDTSYTVKVRVKLSDDVYSGWRIIEFKTLEPPKVPPNKPVRIEVIETTTDSIHVSVSEVMFATSYVWYLNNKEIAQTNDLEYIFENLDDNKTYTLSCRSMNEYGKSRYSVVKLVRTLEKVKPKVTSVTSSNGGYTDSGNLKKNINWQGSNVVEGYELYIDGVLVKEFDSTTNESVIDFEELGLDDGFHDIEVKPKDPNGIGYKVRISNQSTSNEDLDEVVGFIDEASQILKRAGMFLVLSIVMMALTFVSTLFLFNKFKLSLVTTTSEQLEADPDKAMAIDFKKNDGMDKQFKELADVSEDSYFKAKKENDKADKTVSKDKESKKATKKKSEDNDLSPATDYVPRYKLKNKSQMTVQLSNSRKNIDINDIDNYLKYSKLNKYDKQLIKNAHGDWEKKSKFKKFNHMGSKDKNLSLGGYRDKSIKGGDTVASKSDIKSLEKRIIDEVNSKTTQ